MTHAEPKPIKVYDCEKPVGVSCLSYKYKRYDGYTFKVSKAGITEVYLYKYGDHTATIKIKVLPPVPKITVDSNINIELLEGEQVSFEILSGGGEYSEGEYKSEENT